MSFWKNIRIFVSSTFIDMDDERDILKDIVEPKLNEFLKNYLCSVEFVDLRHSVKTDNDKTLLEREQAIFNICLEEIDNCMPYFIGIVGHRYGWIPADDGVPCPDIDIPEDFPIPENKLSVTMYEFLHGLFVPQANNQRCLIFLRSKDSYSNLPEEKRKEYIETGEKGEYIKLLRDYITTKKEYSDYTFMPNSDSQEETLRCAELFYNCLLKLIEPEYSTSVEDEHTRFIADQESFVEKHLRNYVGREKDLMECINIILERKNVFVYSTQSGNDVESFFCKLYDLHRKRKDSVCFFYCDFENKNASLEYIIYHWLKEAARNADTDEALEEIRKDKKRLRQFWRDTLSSLINSGKEIYVFFSYINTNKELFKWSKDLYVHLVTMLANSDGKKFSNLLSYEIGSYDDATIQKVIANLRPKVREALLKKENVGNPQWLKIAIGIIDRMTKSDFAHIRTRDEGDNEEKIWRYQVELVENMPDDTEDLLLHKINKFKTLIDSDFIDNYLMLISLSLSINENKTRNKKTVGATEAEFVDPHLGWEESYLAEILDIDLSNIVFLRQMLGTDIICKTVEGLWNFADGDLHEYISSNYNIKAFRPLLRKAYNFVSQLPSTDNVAAQTRFKLALINGDTDYCADIIQEDYKTDTDFKYLSHQGLWWFATTYQQQFKSMLQTMLNNNRHWNYDFFYNLLHWLPILKRQTKYYLLLIETVIIHIRSLWIDKKIDLNTYSSIVEAYAAKIETYFSTEDYQKMRECLEYGIQLARDYCAENVNFLNFYHFVLFRMIHYYEDNESLAPFLNSTIIRDEKADIYHYPPDFDATPYCLLLHLAAKNLVLTGRKDEAEPLVAKAFNLQFGILKSCKDLLTTLSTTDILLNIALDLKLALKLHYHYGMMQRESLLQLISQAYQYFEKAKKHDDYLKYDIISETFFIISTQHLFLQDKPLAEKIKELSTLQKNTFYLYTELDSDKVIRPDFFYYILQDNDIEKTIWAWCQSLLLYLMSFDTDLTLPFNGEEYYLDDGTIGKTDRRTFKAMQAQSLSFIYPQAKLNNYEMDENWSKIILITYLAMMRGEWAEFNPDLGRMVQLYNSCGELLDNLKGCSVYPQAFEDELVSYHDIIMREIDKPENKDIDTEAFFELEQWWDECSQFKNMHFINTGKLQ